MWVGTFSETASAVPFVLDARAHALGGGARVEVQRVTSADLTIEGETRDEVGAAFDALRTSIYDVAREAYSHGRRDSYTLTAADFR